MKYYDFLDKSPQIGRLVIVEGTESLLAQRALDTLIDRLIPPDVRDLNLTRFRPEDVGDAARVREAVEAMPFLADRRVVVVSDAQSLRAQERRDLWAAAQHVPDGNTLVIVDLLSPRSQRPEPFGARAGKTALRVDTTATVETRRRFIEETLRALGAKAVPAAVSALAERSTDLAGARADLEKLALSGRTITFADLERESLSADDPKAYLYARSLVEGKTAQAFGTVDELFDLDPRSAAVALLSALASELSLVWDLARPGGKAPARFAWRERGLRPLARRIGERRAKAACERAVLAVEAVVTGRAGSDPEEYRTFVQRISAECALIARPAAR